MENAWWPALALVAAAEAAVALVAARVPVLAAGRAPAAVAQALVAALLAPVLVLAGAQARLPVAERAPALARAPGQALVRALVLAAVPAEAIGLHLEPSAPRDLSAERRRGMYSTILRAQTLAATRR